MLVNFSWVRPGAVAGMGLPYESSWPALRAEGVGAVLSLTEDAPAGDPACEGLVALHIPLIDFGVPSPEALARAVEFIRNQVAEGRPVAVHCFAGVGRTGTVIAAWLTTEGLEADAAIAEVRRLRPGSVETRGQADAVRRFAAEGPFAGKAPGGREEPR